MEGLIPVVIGVLFILSYYFSDRFLLLKPFMWICQNFSWPESPRMAFFYGAGGIITGAALMLGVI